MSLFELPLARGWWFAGVASIPLIFALDLATGEELSLSAFYLLCVLAITGAGGRAAGIAAALVSAGLGVLVDLILGAQSLLGTASWWHPWWNGAQRAFVYLVVVGIVSRLMVVVGDLRRAAAEIRTLEGLLPVCAWCKQIRDGDEWKPIERYVSEHTDASVTHGICPTCAERWSEGKP